MKYIVAVSGGVDSVVLLDMLIRGEISLSPSESSWRTEESRKSRESSDAPAPIVNASEGDREISPPSPELIVCHFDHGIRPESDADARFVWELAKKYGVPCEIRREELGAHASEALARERRYAFLHDIAEKYHGASIVTAHHQDDLIETIAINLSRGTAWRGVAVLGGNKVKRPLLGLTKQMLRDYALVHELEWVEDETNATDDYQRNRLRRRLHGLPDDARQTLLKLWNDQLALRVEIEREVEAIGSGEMSRYFFTMIPDSVALELLRARVKGRLTRPQLTSMLLAIKTFRAGQKFEAGNGMTLSFGLKDFTMKDTSGLI